MSERVKKLANRQTRQARTRSSIHGTQERPRLTVTISLAHVSAQLIDDDAQKTLVSATSIGKKMTGTMTEKATAVGAEIAKKAQQAKIKKTVFDRGARKYHGRIKALADSARKNGLEF